MYKAGAVAAGGGGPRYRGIIPSSLSLPRHPSPPPLQPGTTSRRADIFFHCLSTFMRASFRNNILISRSNARLMACRRNLDPGSTQRPLRRIHGEPGTPSGRLQPRLKRRKATVARSAGRTLQGYRPGIDNDSQRNIFLVLPTTLKSRPGFIGPDRARSSSFLLPLSSSLSSCLLLSVT